MSLYTRGKSCYIMTVPSGWLKVGVADDVERREKEIQAYCYEKVDACYRTGISGGSPVCAFEMERLVHQKLRPFAGARREWFRVSIDHAVVVWAATFRFLAMPVGHPDMAAELCAHFSMKRRGEARFIC